MRSCIARGSVWYLSTHLLIYLPSYLLTLFTTNVSSTRPTRRSRCSVRRSRRARSSRTPPSTCASRSSRSCWRSSGTRRRRAPAERLHLDGTRLRFQNPPGYTLATRHFPQRDARRAVCCIFFPVAFLYLFIYLKFLSKVGWRGAWPTDHSETAKDTFYTLSLNRLYNLVIGF